MHSRIRNRRGTANKEDDVEEDTKEFFLNRKVTVKEGKDVANEYRIGEFLGSGKFGDVNRCVEKQTGNELAAKFIPISSSDEKEAVMNEVEIMRKLRHPRLIQLYDVFVLRDKIALIMELITGGELFERVIDESFELDEATCERFMREILQGVEYIHSQRVIHLDLKPENILCLSRTGFKIKIIDFGLARETGIDEVRVMFGTPEFVAPEVISFEPVTFATDMWSVGVVCYVLLSGLSPFMGDNEGETLSNIVRCNYTFDYTEFNDISADAKDFITQLLKHDPRKRNSAAKCLEHPWLKVKPRLKRTATVNKKRLRHFVYRRKWQKAVNAIIALLRMGVVLTQPSKEPEYRKLLQAKSTKTAALLKKLSRDEKPMGVEIKRNISVGNRDEPSLAVKDSQKVHSADSSRPEQIKVGNATEKVAKEATPPTIKPTPMTTKTPGLNALQTPVSKPGTKPVQVNAAHPQPPPVTPKTVVTPPSPLSKPPSKPTTSNAISPPSAAVKVTPSLAKTTTQNALPKKIETPKLPTHQTAPEKPAQKSNAIQNTTSTGRTSASPAFQSTSGSNRKPSVQNADSAVMSIVKLSKTPRGSVADRISFFNKPENETKQSTQKGAKKKFSIFS